VCKCAQNLPLRAYVADGDVDEVGGGQGGGGRGGGGRGGGGRGGGRSGGGGGGGGGGSSNSEAVSDDGRRDQRGFRGQDAQHPRRLDHRTGNQTKRAGQ
jgi:hypothetical protein